MRKQKADSYNEFCKNEHELVDAYLFLNRLGSTASLNNVFKYAKSIGNIDLQIKSLEVLGEYFYIHANYKKLKLFLKSFSACQTNQIFWLLQRIFFSTLWMQSQCRRF